MIAKIQRVIIEGVDPEIDCGRFPAKRVTGDPVEVRADIFTDGHDQLGAALLYRHESATSWRAVAMQPLVNDRWEGVFRVSELGAYFYTIQAWVDSFQGWLRDIKKKFDAGQSLPIDFLTGAAIIQAASLRAKGQDSARLLSFANQLKKTDGTEPKSLVELAAGAELASLMSRYVDRANATTYERKLEVRVDREKARCSAWYEMFPRSCAAESGNHGTFRDCIERLDYIADMGFDVLYLPPIHPIGRTERKGPNNVPSTSSEDVGSPWAIGAREGGHKSILPALGTIKDFELLVEKAKSRGIELALDIAFQCAPDHPYAHDHPEWFRRRPDGTIQYAENPPKKYQDIYPIDFESPQYAELCEELKSVFLYWIEHGVRIFRVDNPHTKPFAFWQWVIAEIRRDFPDVIFLAEAFTRPKVMYRLAKLGFTQSYTYFTWRNTKFELQEYFTELTTKPVRDFFRPNLWPNTPDILNEYLQVGGRPAFMARFVLAATLGANYGIYGPAFELCENRPIRQGSEEYLDSEKYQLRHWDLGNPDGLKPLISLVNAIRRENPALHGDWGLAFHPTDNDNLIAYTKATGDLSNVILVVVNLDSRFKQSGWVSLALDALKLSPDTPFEVHDLLTGNQYRWQGSRNFIELDPQLLPAHIFRLHRPTRNARDFDNAV